MTRPRHQALRIADSSVTRRRSFADEGMSDVRESRLPQFSRVWDHHLWWLEHLRLASVRLNDGGSGSFILLTVSCSPIIMWRSASFKTVDQRA